MEDVFGAHLGWLYFKMPYGVGEVADVIRCNHTKYLRTPSKNCIYIPTTYIIRHNKYLLAIREYSIQNILLKTLKVIPFFEYEGQKFLKFDNCTQICETASKFGNESGDG